MCSHSLKRILAKFPPTPQHLKLAHTITLNLLNSTTTTIPCLAPHVAYRVLSHPSLPPRSCLAFFHLLNPNPDLTAHLILLFRLFQAQNFASFKSTLNSLLTQAQIKHPVSSLISLLDHYQFQSHPNFLRTLCDILFRLCADNGMFQDAFNVFDYGTAKASLIEPRSCFVLLLAFKKRAHFHLCEPFFRRMVDSARVDIGVQSLTLVVDVLCRNGDVERAKALIHEMAARGVVTPNVFTYNTLLNACVARKDRNGVGEVLALMEREGVVLSLASYTILIQWHAGCGRIREAEKLFDEMRERNVEMDVYVYTSMISWNCREGNVRRALALFDEMISRGVAPNARTFGALISGVCKAGEMEAAQILLEEMQSKGVDLNGVIFNTMMDGYCRRGMVDDAFRLKVIMEGKGLEPDVFTYSTLASGLCRLHRYEEAKGMLNVMVERGVALNVVTCTLFIEIYCKEGSLAEAERFLRNMEKKGVVPNVVTYNTLIDAFSKKEKVKRAHMLKAEMIEKGLLPDVFTYTSLIHGECIVGRVDEALKIFNEMLVKGISGNVKTYTAIISGLSKEGRADEAFKFYDEMTRMGLTPDDRVFAALVGSLHKSSSHAGAEQNEFGELKTDTSDTSSWSNTGLSSSHRKAART
ncbi:pentatricopeptide repeat-containing protein At2g32630 [Cajanus cajan]|uniref:pentatricopeptide repeat-containing protein At2g32630 n=1 Tax=Cajanus cajan TaxID=3821 RepID=UPI00098DCB75|nr:pentatricopeptide repeat-containing protein At2g32630 [Cajanus cajan]XP_020205385.1 pentatricopeptide repeat-containing protein At2g32630 [Cajanus cajan]XP_020205398.1 pentatricopeptide repeat-containing protein At2g32630 [Cajanus cajan]XP_020205403.1 pentatricopeptide repeat-containing protein At2g32630 [Cajanus cajan]XP_020205411.1 pentatricopeptide repeat-containing protein At2g32630 [Cajanus cajan]XP_020205416.1 pentatricopeptide repeat-containing protein At2g32630 [Cajanus cajan]XP_02